MRKSKVIIENSIRAIAKNAELCVDLAKAERATADHLHLTAHNHEKLAHSLETGAANLTKELKAISE